MYVNNILRNNDRQIAYLECKNIFKQMSGISDINYFKQEMKTHDKIKSKIEEGLIYMVSKKKLENYEIDFLDIYHRYLNLILEEDIREYYNNNYCTFLLFDSFNGFNNEDEEYFLNDKKKSQIFDLLFSEHNRLMKKMRNNEPIDDQDKMFLENSFLLMSFYDVIYKKIDDEEDLMYEVVDYFTKYPIDDIFDSKNRLLHVLFVLSSRMIQIPGNSAIMFSFDDKYDENGNIVLGSFVKVENRDISCIKINSLDIYDLKTEEKFLEKMFTLFHELGHFMQNEFFDEFNDEIKNRILIEEELVQNHREFYSKYHDSFLIEEDADNYAIVQIVDEYSHNYPDIVYDIISKASAKKRIESSKFYLMEIEEYNSMKNKNKLH